MNASKVSCECEGCTLLTLAQSEKGFRRRRTSSTSDPADDLKLIHSDDKRMRLVRIFLWIAVSYYSWGYGDG